MNWSDKERIPKTYMAEVFGTRLVISRSIHLLPDQWHCCCYGMLGIPEHVLKSKDLEEAKKEAINYFKNYVEVFLEKLNE